MPFSNSLQYDPIPNDGDTIYAKSEELDDVSGYGGPQTFHRRTVSNKVSRTLAIANLVLFLVLLGTWISLLKQSDEFLPKLDPPYCKLPSLHFT